MWSNLTLIESEIRTLNQASISVVCSRFLQHHLTLVIPDWIMCGDAEFNCVIPGKEGGGEEGKQKKTSSNNPICEL